MTDRDVMDKLIMDCFTHSMVWNSAGVTMALDGKYSRHKVERAMLRLFNDGRLSRRKMAENVAYVYWVDVRNLVKPPVLSPLDFGAKPDIEPVTVHCDPIISEPVYPTKHHKARAAVHSSWVATLLFYGMAIVIVGLIVN